MQCPHAVLEFGPRQAKPNQAYCRKLQVGGAGVRLTDPFRGRVAGIILGGQVGVALRSAGTPRTIRVDHAVSCSRHGTVPVVNRFLQVSKCNCTRWSSSFPYTECTGTGKSNGVVQSCYTLLVCSRIPEVDLAEKCCPCSTNKRRTCNEKEHKLQVRSKVTAQMLMALSRSRQ